MTRFSDATKDSGIERSEMRLEMSSPGVFVSGGPRRHLPLDLLAQLPVSNVEVVLGLQVDPKLGRCSEIHRKP